MSIIEIRRAGDRARTHNEWLDSRHSFNFGGHVERSNDGHGLLTVFNDDRVVGGGGFGTHAHRDMEIVTWVLQGRLAHEDSEGNAGELYPGLAQRMSAGSGIRHSEMNASRTDSVHFLQMWITPDHVGGDPGYEQLDVNATLQSGGMHRVVDGRESLGAIRIGQANATLWAGRLTAGERFAVPKGRHVHLFVAIGEISLTGTGRMIEGDAARLTSVEPLDAVAGPSGAEVLTWVMN
jgi:redox-sensitive bicupin YhaK (pirin superfamily)